LSASRRIWQRTAAWIAQRLTSDRHGRIRDAIVKIGGGALGIAAGRATLNFGKVSRWFQN
jgi:hypothetical protein